MKGFAGQGANAQGCIQHSAQRLVHSCLVRKSFCHFRLQDDDIGLMAQPFFMYLARTPPFLEAKSYSLRISRGLVSISFLYKTSFRGG